MNETPSTCPRCGTPLTADELAGGCPRCLANALLTASSRMPSNASVGQVFCRLGDYELLEEVARGGMGVVYRARQVSLDRIVAVKLMRDSALAGADEVRRFKVEAAAAAKLKHANIVAIHEVGETDGQHWFAMDLVEGSNLMERTREGPLAPRVAAGLVAAIADAVQHAHERGVLHRDLKPSNVLVDGDGQPFVTDFGLARTLEGDSSLTLTGQVLGTPGYMPPEQATGKGTVGPAADIYSLGALLYHLLTGRAPFVGGTPAETMRHVVEQEPVSPQLLNPEVPRDLASVCLKCLAKRAGERYVSSAELAADLRRFGRGEPTAARPAGMVRRLTRWCQRKPALAGSLAFSGLVALLGFFGVLWQWRDAVAARDSSRRSEAARVEQLWQSLCQQAQSSVRSGKIGQRTNTLAAVGLAAAIRPSLELRNDGIAALLLPDLGRRLSWKQGAGDIFPWCFDSRLEHYVLHDEQGQVGIYRAADHSLVRMLGRGAAGTAYAQFSPDERFLAVSFESDQKPLELRVWEWRTGRLLAVTTNAHAKFGIPSFDFTPDSRELIYADRSAGLGRLNLADGLQLPPLLTNITTSMVRVSPDGASVATGKNLRVDVWEMASWQRLATADFSTFSNEAYLQTMVWSPNGGGMVVSVYGTGLHLLRLDGSPPEHFGDDKNIVATSLFFNTVGDLLFVGGWNDRFEIWDVATLTPLIKEVLAHGAPRALSRDGRRVALVRENVGLGIWEFFEPTGLRRFSQPLDAPPYVMGLDVHPSGRWLLTAHSKCWLLWDAARARVVARGDGQITQVKFTSDGGAFHTCGPDGLRRWPLRERLNVKSDAPIAVGPAELLIPGLPALALLDKASSVAAHILPLLKSLKWRYIGSVFSADRRYVALLGNGYILRINLTNPDEARPIRMRRTSDTSYGISADGRWLWTGRHNQSGLDLYNLEEGEFVKTISQPGLGDGRFQPRSGEFVTTTTRGLSFWQPGEWKLDRKIPLTEVGLGRGLVAFAPDARVAWYGGASKMHLLDVAAGRFFATLEHPGSLYAEVVAFDSTAAHAYAANINGVAAWDFTALRRELARLGLDWPDENPGGGFR